MSGSSGQERRDPLALTCRLARRRLEAMSREVAETNARLQTLRAEVERLSDPEQTAEVGVDSVAALVLFGGYVEACRVARRAALARIDELQRQRTERVGRMIAQRVELKRLELVIERREQRARAAAERRMQRALDEMGSRHPAN